MLSGLAHVKTKIEQLREESNTLQSKLDRRLHIWIKKLKSSRHFISDDMKTVRQLQIDLNVATIRTLSSETIPPSADTRGPPKRPNKAKKSHPVPTEKEKLETQIKLLKLMQVRTQAVERLILELQNDEDFLSHEVTEQMIKRFF